MRVFSLSRATLRQVPACVLALCAAAATAAVPAPPVISGEPAGSVMAGKTYTFQPAVQDPAGTTLWFGILNKPSWATLNPRTGLLTGTPSSAEVGTYSNIRIYATDGQLWGTTSTFSITVEPTFGTATLYWTDPTESADGAALTNLAGYRLYFGTSPSNLSPLVELPDPAASTYRVKDLASATWYFAITAYTTTGAESRMSQIVSKVVN